MELLGMLQRLVIAARSDISALPDRVGDRVHAVRVRMKKFRAVLRLLEPAVAAADLRKADRAARDLKECFGSLRDNDVQRELLEDLLERREAREVASRLGLFETVVRLGDDLREAAVRRAAGLEGIVNRLNLKCLTAGGVARCWEVSYREARGAMKDCVGKKADDFLLHEWRKRVKAVLYQSQAIGSPLEAFSRKAELLSSTLGAQHDLAILCGMLSAQPTLSHAERAVLAKKAAHAQRALRQGAKLFSKKPSAFRQALTP